MADKVDPQELKQIVQERVQAALAAGRRPEAPRIKAEVTRELRARDRKAKQADVRRNVKETIHSALRLRRFTARVRLARISPRKVRDISNLIRGKDVNTADAILKTVAPRGAALNKKLLQSAVANATYLTGTERTDLDVNRLHVVETEVAPGPIMYRARPSSERHPYRIRKRFSHIRIVLEERDLPLPKKERGRKPTPPKEEKKPEAPKPEAKPTEKETPAPTAEKKKTVRKKKTAPKAKKAAKKTQRKKKKDGK